MKIKKTLKSIIAGTLISASALLSHADDNKYGVDFNIYNDLGYGTSGIEEKIPDNWQNKYYPNTRTMDTSEIGGIASWDIGIGIEPYCKPNNDWKLGIPIKYSISALCSDGYLLPIDKPIKGTDVEWWDTVALARIMVEKKTPAFGISVQRKSIELEATVQQYGIYQQDFRGVDHVGAKNGAATDGETTLEEGWSQRISLYYHMIDDSKDKKEDYRIFGLFYEQIGSDTWVAGITFKGGINLFESK